MSKAFGYFIKSCTLGTALYWSISKLNKTHSFSTNHINNKWIGDHTNIKIKDTQIREARESDVPELEKLFLSVRQETFKWENPKNFKIEDYKKSTEGEKVFVAEKDQAIAGFVSIWEADSFIHNLFVYPKYQGVGIGKQLLKKAVESVPHPITMKVVTYNIKACGFYESQGWKKVSTHDDTPPYHLYSYGSADSSPKESVELIGSSTEE